MPDPCALEKDSNSTLCQGGLSSNRPLLYWVPSSDPLTVCDRWRAHNYSLVGELFKLEGDNHQWQVVGMASSVLDPRQHPQILAVPFPSRGHTTPSTLDLRQARFGRKWQPLPHDLVLTLSEGDAPHSSDMEISDDDRPIPSSAGWRACVRGPGPWSPKGRPDAQGGRQACGMGMGQSRRKYVR